MKALGFTDTTEAHVQEMMSGVDKDSDGNAVAAALKAAAEAVFGWRRARVEWLVQQDGTDLRAFPTSGMERFAADKKGAAGRARLMQCRLLRQSHWRAA